MTDPRTVEREAWAGIHQQAAIKTAAETALQSALSAVPPNHEGASKQHGIIAEADAAISALSTQIKELNLPVINLPPSGWRKY